MKALNTYITEKFVDIDNYKIDKKYELTDKSFTFNGVTLHRIRALKSIKLKVGTIREGDLGGWVESEANLSQSGNCWTFGNTYIYGNARVYDDAMLYGNARVYDNAQVYGKAVISGDARVYGDAKVYDEAKVMGDAQVYGKAEMCQSAVALRGDRFFLKKKHKY